MDDNQAQPCSWPEQDAVEKWWESHRYELKVAVSKYRIQQDQRIAALEAALKESRNLAAQAATFEVDAATSTEPGSDVFGSAGIAKKSLTKRARDAWKQYDNLVDSVLAGSTSALSDYAVSIRKEVYLKLGKLLFPERPVEFWKSYWDEDCPADPEDGMIDALTAYGRGVAVETAQRCASVINGYIHTARQVGSDTSYLEVARNRQLEFADALRDGTAEVPKP